MGKVQENLYLLNDDLINQYRREQFSFLFFLFLHIGLIQLVVKPFHRLGITHLALLVLCDINVLNLKNSIFLF